VLCEEQRYITDVVVRSKQDIYPWLKDFANARVGSMQTRKLLSETQYVLELDSTNYDDMTLLTQQINEKNWPYQVALLGSASSRLIFSDQWEEKTPLLEVLNISFSVPNWEIVMVASDGLLFLSTESIPLPCIHNTQSCCVSGYARKPFKLGLSDFSKASSCSFPTTNTTQNLRDNTVILKSKFTYNNDGSITLLIHESEIDIVAKSQMNYSNFSVGLVSKSSMDVMATQVYISLQKKNTFYLYSVGNFTRQVTPYILMQLEKIHHQTFIRCWAKVTLADASVVFVQYAWKDMNWIIPICNMDNQTCIKNIKPCQATVVNGWLELWVPITNYSRTNGNVSLYFVLQAGNNLARVMTQAKPEIAQSHCDNLTVTEHIDIEIFQGLQIRQIYKGSVVPNIPLNIEPNVDTLITMVIRSGKDAMIEELQAIHAQNDTERRLVESNEVCETCVVEQLVLDFKAVSSRSCFVFGNGNSTQWIENYVGLPGSLLALDIFSKLPIDLQTGDSGGVWINPVWPYKTDAIINASTYLYVKFYYPRVAGTGRRLLSVHDEPVVNSQQRLSLRSTWMLIACVALFLLLATFFQAIIGY